MPHLIPVITMLAAAPMLGAKIAPQEAPQAPTFVPQFGPQLGELTLAEVQSLVRECDDRTWQAVQRDRGQPLLDRRPADPDEPLLFKAVDHEVEGCAVLLVGDGDIRPLPAPQEGPLLQPAQ
ncbi:hypothetical protein GRI62_06030 [Erythrobacter arachoides]|uniref:Uncharacterized protein n=1 Tax=Aurantiacibacter arachoides TaxID=1850444 RepID=A0A844ZZ45_9SPHN|nr:hypothetical protein [Aurantiacibacter arachoides]MXO93165.1 hypothetical protein [Aurantiacibacter arachoides]GGD51524.1 hypothetical protein GCM10011411_09190 [Aurantiacibacter arachoides]